MTLGPAVFITLPVPASNRYFSLLPSAFCLLLLRPGPRGGRRRLLSPTPPRAPGPAPGRGPIQALPLVLPTAYRPLASRFWNWN